MKNRYMVVRSGLALAAAVCLTCPALAQQGRSTNYSAPPGLFAHGSGVVSSTNFQQAGLLGDTFVQADCSSLNYRDGPVISVLLPVAIGLSKTTLTFNDQSVGTSSPIQTVTLSNTGPTTGTINSITASGDFSQSNTCGDRLNAGSSCIINVSFSPSSIGLRTGVLTILSNASDGPHTANLSGTGTSPAGWISPILNLLSGWNLVGNGIEAPISVAFTFSDSNKIMAIWKWIPSGTTPNIDYPTWAFYSPSLPDGGQATAAMKGYEFLTVINAGDGYWVNAKTAFSVSLPSGAPVQSTSFMPAVANPPTPGGIRALPHRWSLIATGDSPTPARFDANIATAYSAPPTEGQVYVNLTTLWAWDAAQGRWYFWEPNLFNSGGLSAYIASKYFLDFLTMPTTPTGTLSPATGFWVNMP